MANEDVDSLPGILRRQAAAPRPAPPHRGPGPRSGETDRGRHLLHRRADAGGRGQQGLAGCRGEAARRAPAALRRRRGCQRRHRSHRASRPRGIEGSRTPAAGREEPTMELILEVPGMTCGHCEAAVKGEVGKLAGVERRRRRPRHQAGDGGRTGSRPAVDHRRHRRGGLRGRWASRGTLMARSAVIRIAAFVLVIGGRFGTAYGLGRKLPGNPESQPHSHATAVADPVPPGFAVDGYVLVTDADQTSTSALALHVNGPDGQRVTEYTEAHGSKLHVVLVRPDLSGFQHIHPDDRRRRFVRGSDRPAGQVAHRRRCAAGRRGRTGRPGYQRRRRSTGRRGRPPSAARRGDDRRPDRHPPGPELHRHGEATGPLPRASSPTSGRQHT